MTSVTRVSRKTRVRKTERAPSPPSQPFSAGFVSSDAFLESGKKLRDTIPRASQGEWNRPKHRVNPLEILHAEDAGRLPELIPIRYGRMLQTPFTYFRGAANVMAADLADTPSIGVNVQACGDCHLLNFGGFATPERNIIFEINDFDETSPAPWEWDLKRLVTSFVLAARSNGLSEGAGRDAAVSCARSYRERLREMAEMSPLEAWYAHLTAEDLMSLVDRDTRKRMRKRIEKATSRPSSDLVYPKLADMVGGQAQIKDQPPLIFHPAFSREEHFRPQLEKFFANYRNTLPDDRRVLLDHYRLVDVAIKVVGIGSVGRYCAIGLLMSPSNQPLFLQFKQATPSVLERYAGKSIYPHAGQRVVMGQKLMQSASDIFLGWTTAFEGRELYVRQLRDVKIKPLVETANRSTLATYGAMCGWALARAHCRTSQPWLVCGYLGNGDEFDEAMGDFAVAYADQTERDHAALKAAVAAGRIEAAPIPAGE